MTLSDEASRQQFPARWTDSFRELPPLGWQLRHAHPERWVRFHALPGKRCPARGASEQDEFLHRANALGETLFGSRAPVWLVMPNYGPDYERWISRYGGRAVLTWRNPSDDDDAVRHDFYVAAMTWQSGTFDDLLRDVAKDKVRVIFTNSQVTRVFAPYDCGFDVIWTPHDTDKLRQRFRVWLSSRADGL